MKFRLAPGLSMAVACCLVLTACSSYKVQMGWPPIYKKPAPVPEAVNELNLVNADGTPANFPQYWKRNTLVIDLSAIGAAGNFAARLPEGTTWPVRVGVRVRPGSVGQIEILGEERNILPVAAEGTAAHRSRVRAQRLHTEDRGYLHFLGADGRGRGRAFGAGVGSSRIRVTH